MARKSMLTQQRPLLERHGIAGILAETFPDQELVVPRFVASGPNTLLRIEASARIHLPQD